jgi:DinB family protein
VLAIRAESVPTVGASWSVGLDGDDAESATRIGIINTRAILSAVIGWGPLTYGDPCRECGFQWTMSQDEAIALVSATPHELSVALSVAEGSERHQGLDWPVVAYVCHIGDNLRIWAERLAALASGDHRPVARYDENLMAEARRYSDVALVGALWSLGRAVDDWVDAVAFADGAGVVLVHPDRGEQSLLDVVRSNAHDAFHHRQDIGRILRTLE